MDLGHEVWKTRVLLGGCLLLIVSGCYSVGEARYLLQGKTTDATVGQVREIEVRSRYGMQHKLAVEYSFRDGDSLRTEEDQVPLDWPRPAGTVKVQYLASSAGDSRLDGHNERHWVFVFLGILAVCGFFVMSIIKEANQPARRYRRGRIGG